MAVPRRRSQRRSDRAAQVDPDPCGRGAGVGRPGAAEAAVAILLFAIVCAVLGCREDDATGSARARTDCADRVWRVAVASSLRDMAVAAERALAELDPPVRVETTLGPSNLLARQLELGAPIDVLVSADARIVDDGIRAGRLDAASAREVARGRLVLVAPPGSPFEGAGEAALRDPRATRVAIPADPVPLGRYARSWLEARGLLEPLAGRIVVTESARATLAAVAQSHVSLAFVYESDRRIHPTLVIVDRPAPATFPAIRYVLAHAARAPACPDRARIDAAWTGPAMRRHLERAGFEAPGTGASDGGFPHEAYP